tara:strand:+ start:1395 stop:2540 length:1146 start_codon:yes stop_codon:yes gene_type:complete
MKRNKKIFFLTVGRSDFFRQKSIFDNINKKKNIDTKLIISGSHKLGEFGKTIRDIKLSKIKYYDCSIKNYSFNKSEIVSNLNKITKKIDDLIKKKKPDIFVIFGDRYEMLGGALACFGKKILLVHIHGGSITKGSFDDVIRHSLTKLSHFHYTPINEYAKRIRQMGEENFRIKVVGAPGLDNIIEYSNKIDDDLIKSFIKKKYILVCFHSETNNLKSLEKQLNCISQIIKKININFVITYPNTDPGCLKIIKCFKNLKKNYPKKILLIKNAGSNFYHLLKKSEILIGNSSSGIVESPTFNKSTINIGDRQKGKLIPKNVINSNFNFTKLSKLISYYLKKKNSKKIKNPYGDGKSGKKIVKLLNQIQLSKEKNYIKGFVTIK